MAGYVPKPNSGTLWPNEYKKNENHPDVRGDLYLDLSMLKTEWAKAENNMLKVSISGWSKEIAGKQVLSISAAAPYVKPAESAPPAAPSNFDEDAPF
jgi:hypothetical protein